MTAQEFIEKYTSRGYEKGDTQIFWLDLLAALFGIEDATDKVEFEKSVAEYGGKGYIDVYMPETNVLIEQKSSHIDLYKPEIQSDGASLSPFQQAKRYANYLPYDLKPRWIITCNFREFRIHDMNCPHIAPECIMLEELATDNSARARLNILVDRRAVFIRKQTEICMEACRRVSLLYDALEKQYIASGRDYSQDINTICVRLVFLFYAENMQLFGGADIDKFGKFLKGYHTPKQVRSALKQLFRILDTPLDKRDPYDAEFNDFPYVDGGLFADDTVQLPNFDEDIVRLITEECSYGFDWRGISPTIFGALFESTLGAKIRREGGMHYTEPENIHKAIDPLFINDLIDEYDSDCYIADVLERESALRALQDKIAGFKFLDPAAGSGNFLTETYLTLRRLENEILSQIGDKEITVHISNFFGIELNSYAVTVAKTAMWISEIQMMKETESITKSDIKYFPIKDYAHIVRGNALKLEWDTLHAVPNLFEIADDGLSEEARVYDYIIGNPPFVGARMMKKKQKEELVAVFGKKWKNVGDLDYVCAWYKKCFDLIKDKSTRACFVSTNSICQGGSVCNLWKPLFENKLQIDFAFRTFKWMSQSDKMAQVYCVVIAFHCGEPNEKKYFYEQIKKEYVPGEPYKYIATEAKNINGYLLDAPSVFIEKSNKPICDVPEIFLGGQAIDDGNLILTEEEKEKLIKKEPNVEGWIRPYMMGKDFINRRPRYCLWLVDVPFTEIKKSSSVYRRIKKVKEFRLKSERDNTLKSANAPSLFAEIKECKSPYIAIPKVSSEQRKYIPIDFLPADIIPGDKLFVCPNASLYHFAILTSTVHMAWVRVVAGRLGLSISYSNTIVYNNFIWPELTDKDKKKLEGTAQAILDARAKYPEASFADMYDTLVMPMELQKAHKANDRLVMKLYGFDAKATEEEIVGRLMEMYAEKVGSN